MNYEEKYKEALERAKAMIKVAANQDEAIGFANTIFPELKESEDEMIRKGIIRNLEYLADRAEGFVKDELKERIAWLEKQGEQKGYTFKSIPRLLDMIEPSDKANAYCQKLIDTLVKEGYNTDAKIVEEVLKGWNGEDVPMAVMDEQKPVFEMKTPEESLGIDSDTYNKIVDECIYGDGEQNPADKLEPKFHKGEWIVWKEKCYKINYNGCGYELVDQDGLSTSLEYGTINENAHLWDITKDAKDGDVLVDRFSKDNIIILYKGINPKFSILAYCGWNGYNLSIKTNGLGYGNLDNTNYLPATKEQRDTLMKAMTDAGYTFNFVKKVLKNIEQELTDNNMKEALRTEYEKGRADAIAEIQNPVDCIDCTNSKGCINCEDGNMKETLVQNLTWSEEDECYMSECIGAIATKDGWSFEEKRKTKHWLKSLKDRVQLQSKQEWSEEDESTIKDIIEDLEYAEAKGYVLKNNIFLKEINWLKSIKDRHTWKPSDEEMKALADALSLAKSCGEDYSFDLRTLYEQLKKLKKV